MRVILGLGNPGARYDATRHNVGWWVLDRLSYDWGFGAFSRDGPSQTAGGSVEGQDVLLVKPLTYMNRSGAALGYLAGRETYDPAADLLVIVDDATLDVGRVRFRARGSAGGHNGLKSVSQVLGTQDYCRLRVGVGVAPPGADLADWVLSPMPGDDEETVVGLLPELTRGVEVWLREGVEAAMNSINR